MRIANAAPQDKVQRLTRRVEALEMRIHNFIITPAAAPVVPQVEAPPSKREEALLREVEVLKEQFKAMEKLVEEMAQKLTALTTKNVMVSTATVKCGVHLDVIISSKDTTHLKRISENSRP